MGQALVWVGQRDCRGEAWTAMETKHWTLETASRLWEPWQKCRSSGSPTRVANNQSTAPQQLSARAGKRDWRDARQSTQQTRALLSRRVIEHRLFAACLLFGGARAGCWLFVLPPECADLQSRRRPVLLPRIALNAAVSSLPPPYGE